MTKSKHFKKFQPKKQAKDKDQIELKPQKTNQKSCLFIQNEAKPELFSLFLLIKPNARENRLYKEGEHYCLNISAPPTKGKANSAIVKFLSAKLKISKSAIQLIRGHTASTKTFSIFIPNCTREDVEKRLLN